MLNKEKQGVNDPLSPMLLIIEIDVLSVGTAIGAIRVQNKTTLLLTFISLPQSL